jgi:hypothetical protein
MIEKGKIDPEIQARVNLFRYRTPEEFYDLQNDPNSTHNLANDQAYSNKLQQYRNKMKEWMKKYNDPLLQVLSLLDKRPEMRQLMDKIYASELRPGKLIKGD